MPLSTNVQDIRWVKDCSFTYILLYFVNKKNTLWGIRGEVQNEDKTHKVGKRYRKSELTFEVLIPANESVVVHIKRTLITRINLDVKDFAPDNFHPSPARLKIATDKRTKVDEPEKEHIIQIAQKSEVEVKSSKELQSNKDLNEPKNQQTDQLKPKGDENQKEHNNSEKKRETKG